MTDDSFDFTYQLTDVETPSLAVVYAVARYTGRSVLDLPPLADYMDPDALDRAVRTEETTCTFRYEGCLIRVDQERVTLRKEG